MSQGQRWGCESVFGNINTARGPGPGNVAARAAILSSDSIVGDGGGGRSVACVARGVKMRVRHSSCSVTV